MRKLLFSLFAATAFFLVGCLETTQEITLNEDGSGTLSNKSDMSQLIGMAKQMGGAEEMEKAGDQKIDSTISLAEGADSIPNLSPEEKDMIRKGTLNINIDLKAEKFLTKLDFPFTSPTQLSEYTRLSNKIMAETMKSQMGDGAAMGGGDMPAPTSFDDYYTYSFSAGELKRQLNKEKYAGAESDEYLKGLKEAGGMGLMMKANYIINLPRPAKEVIGKGAKLSADKRTVTLSADINDFFDDATLLEYTIKY